MSVRNNLSREDWIAAAQKVLISGGIDAVRIDTLAKEMKITRGSFYYHFKSRGELLSGILDAWRAQATEDVIKNLRSANHQPVEQLQLLLELPHRGQRAKDAAAIELAIRAWARRDAQARQAMNEVDSHRLTYIESLLLQAGTSPEEAMSRARLVYAYQISMSLLGDDKDPDHAKRTAQIAAILIPS
ncbi:TetR/AcrR family transcriptional regulator [Pseudomonas sp. S75]|uniref:TetR/AcrR family transcriptional regulator n=1 Tax=unclassified Pseudomonas TaxID=196821 RepID=UPI001909045A|nr:MULTISPECIES: TetR/AcrR family transcriptional regulator [unclassified Pseudomonas]MBJ9974184.1 TetR/AcrR family transcriptional regulator [Pseudomonas sp. S30]MBK0151886.1 TetR/AcrR family transcriptional regulator [Pseudomonas sp. S75]